MNSQIYKVVDEVYDSQISIKSGRSSELTKIINEVKEGSMHRLDDTMDLICMEVESLNQIGKRKKMNTFLFVVIIFFLTCLYVMGTLFIIINEYHWIDNALINSIVGLLIFSMGTCVKRNTEIEKKWQLIAYTIIFNVFLFSLYYAVVYIPVFIISSILGFSTVVTSLCMYVKSGIMFRASISTTILTAIGIYMIGYDEFSKYDIHWMVTLPVLLTITISLGLSNFLMVNLKSNGSCFFFVNIAPNLVKLVISCALRVMILGVGFDIGWDVLLPIMSSICFILGGWGMFNMFDRGDPIVALGILKLDSILLNLCFILHYSLIVDGVTIAGFLLSFFSVFLFVVTT
jgi:hypothetical protein